MYTASLYFSIDRTDKKNIVSIFFADWTDRICNNEVSYTIMSTTSSTVTEIIRVDFVNAEDAMAVMLKGVPEEFNGFLTALH